MEQTASTARRNESVTPSQMTAAPMQQAEQTGRAAGWRAEHEKPSGSPAASRFVRSGPDDQHVRVIQQRKRKAMAQVSCARSMGSLTRLQVRSTLTPGRLLLARLRGRFVFASQCPDA